MNHIRFEVFYKGHPMNNKTLSKQNSQEEPRVIFEGEQGKIYTLLMHDPDAPAKSWLHWLITNISGNIPDITQGDEIMSYAPPSPPSGTHRYIFIMYEQPASIFLRAPEERGHFNVDTFEKEYELKKVAQKIMRVPASSAKN